MYMYIVIHIMISIHVHVIHIMTSTCTYNHTCHMVVCFLYIYSREVNSLLVLVTTPNHLNSKHDPSKCMDELIYIAERSKYQKLLSWEPLFDLDTLSTEPVGCLEYHSGEDVGMTFSFHYYGPKVTPVCCLSVKLFLYLSIYLDLSIYLSISDHAGSPTPCLPTQNLCTNSTFAYVYRILKF